MRHKALSELLAMGVHRNVDLALLCAEHLKPEGLCGNGCGAPRLIDPYDLEDIVKMTNADIKEEKQRFLSILRENELKHERNMHRIAENRDKLITIYSADRDKIGRA